MSVHVIAVLFHPCAAYQTAVSIALDAGNEYNAFDNVAVPFAVITEMLYGVELAVFAGAVNVTDKLVLDIPVADALPTFTPVTDDKLDPDKVID